MPLSILLTLQALSGEPISVLSDVGLFNEMCLE